METKTKILIFAGYTAVAVGVGYYLTPTKTKIETKTVEVEKIVYKEKASKRQDVRKHTVITKTKGKDGSETTKTEIDYDKKTHEKDSSTTTKDLAKGSETSKEVVKNDNRVDVSAMLGIDVHTGDKVYGGSVSKNILGPIKGGAWGLSNGSVGVSGGISF